MIDASTSVENGSYALVLYLSRCRGQCGDTQRSLGRNNVRWLGLLFNAIKTNKANSGVYIASRRLEDIIEKTRNIATHSFYVNL